MVIGQQLPESLGTCKTDFKDKEVVKETVCWPENITKDPSAIFIFF